MSKTRSLHSARTRRAPPPRRVTLALAAALALAGLAAPYLGIAAPMAWLLLGLVWLAIRLAMFETATTATLPVARWRFGSDIASPSLDLAPEDNLAWPVLLLPAGDGEMREIEAPVGFYLYEFRSSGDTDADLPEALPVRVRSTPFGVMLMPDDRAFVLVGPALFAATMLLLSTIWPSILVLVTGSTR